MVISVIPMRCEMRWLALPRADRVRRSRRLGWDMTPVLHFAVARETGILAKPSKSWESWFDFHACGKSDTNGPRIVAHPWSVLSTYPNPGGEQGFEKFRWKPWPELFTLPSPPGRSDRSPLRSAFSSRNAPTSFDSRDFARQRPAEYNDPVPNSNSLQALDHLQLWMIRCSPFPRTK